MGGVTERPQSRGGMRFDVMLCPETGNVKRRPQHLKKLEKRKKRTRRTKEEIEEKLKLAEDRRKVNLVQCQLLIYIIFILNCFSSHKVMMTLFLLDLHTSKNKVTMTLFLLDLHTSCKSQENIATCKSV